MLVPDLKGRATSAWITNKQNFAVHRLYDCCFYGRRLVCQTPLGAEGHGQWACHPLLLMLLFWETDVTSVLHSLTWSVDVLLRNAKDREKIDLDLKSKSMTFAFCVKIFVSNRQIRFFKTCLPGKGFSLFSFFLSWYCIVLNYTLHGRSAIVHIFQTRDPLKQKKGILTEGSGKWLNLRCCTDGPMERHFIQLRVIDYCVEICFSGHVPPILGGPTCSDHKNKNTTSHNCTFVIALRPGSRSCWKC